MKPRLLIFFFFFFVSLGMSGAVYKNSVIVFGGVADDDDGQVKIKSTFFNDLYSFDLERKSV